MSEPRTRWTKTGQPVVGTPLRMRTTTGEEFPGVVVGKLFGHGGNADLIGVIIEDREQGGRISLDWPITRQDGSVIPTIDLEWADE